MLNWSNKSYIGFKHVLLVYFSFENRALNFTLHSVFDTTRVLCMWVLTVILFSYLLKKKKILLGHIILSVFLFGHGYC